MLHRLWPLCLFFLQVESQPICTITFPEVAPFGWFNFFGKNTDGELIDVETDFAVQIATLISAITDGLLLGQLAENISEPLKYKPTFGEAMATLYLGEDVLNGRVNLTEDFFKFAIQDVNNRCWGTFGFGEPYSLAHTEVVKKLKEFHSSVFSATPIKAELSTARQNATSINALGPSAPASSTRSYLVLTFFYGYPETARRDIIHRYLGTLRQVSDADVVIVFDGGFCQEVATLYRAECIDFHTLPSFDSLKNMMGELISHRFAFWADVLDLRRSTKYRGVLASDMRDVIFQAGSDGISLFDQLPVLSAEQPLVVFGEHTSILQGEEGFFVKSCEHCENVNHLVHGFCDGVADKPLINLGVIYGTHDAMRASSRVYGDLLSKTSFQCWDQLLWSLLLWYGDLQRAIGGQVIFLFSETSAACTIGTVSVVEVDDARRVVNLNGDVCVLLHQYDRYPSFRMWIEKGVELKLNDTRVHTTSGGHAQRFHRIIGSMYNHVVRPARIEVQSAVCASPYRLRAPRPNSACFESRLTDSEYKSRLIQYGGGFELRSSTSAIIGFEADQAHTYSWLKSG